MIQGVQNHPSSPLEQEREAERPEEASDVGTEDKRLGRGWGAGSRAGMLEEARREIPRWSIRT